MFEQRYNLNQRVNEESFVKPEDTWEGKDKEAKKRLTYLDRY